MSLLLRRHKQDAKKKEVQSEKVEPKQEIKKKPVAKKQDK